MTCSQIALFRSSADAATSLSRLAGQRVRVHVIGRDATLITQARRAGVRATLLPDPFHLRVHSEAVLHALFVTLGTIVAVNYLLVLLVSSLLANPVAVNQIAWLQPVTYVLATGLPALLIGTPIGLLVGYQRGVSPSDAQRLQTRLQENFTLVVTRSHCREVPAIRHLLVQSGAGLVNPLRGTVDVRTGRAALSTDELVARRDLRTAPLWPDDDDELPHSRSS